MEQVAQEVPHAEQNRHEEEDDTPEEDQDEESSEGPEESSKEQSVCNADAVSSRMNESVSSKQSATPAEAEEAPAKTPPKAEEPKGPINWAARAAAARAAPAAFFDALRAERPPIKEVPIEIAVKMFIGIFSYVKRVHTGIEREHGHG